MFVRIYEAIYEAKSINRPTTIQKKKKDENLLQQFNQKKMKIDCDILKVFCFLKFVFYQQLFGA